MGGVRVVVEGVYGYYVPPKCQNFTRREATPPISTPPDSSESVRELTKQGGRWGGLKWGPKRLFAIPNSPFSPEAISDPPNVRISNSSRLPPLYRPWRTQWSECWSFQNKNRRVRVGKVPSNPPEFRAAGTSSVWVEPGQLTIVGRSNCATSSVGTGITGAAK